MKAFLLFLVLILAASLGYGTWLYFQQTDQLDQTQINLAGLQNELRSLQEQLAVGQANSSLIQGQLLNEKARAAALAAELNTELNNARSQQEAAANQIASLKADLETAKTLVATLASELAAAQALNTGAQAEIAAQIERLNGDIGRLNNQLAQANTALEKANADLTAAKALCDAQLADLSKVKDPRHFYTVEELTAWLAQDDTNTNPAYASLGLADKAFILHVKALRDGLLLPAAIDADSQYIYSWNVAIIGANIYVVTAGTDAINKLETVFQVPPAQRPLPLA